jgi:hypothetical protein
MILMLNDTAGCFCGEDQLSAPQGISNLEIEAQRIPVDPLSMGHS